MSQKRRKQRRRKSSQSKFPWKLIFFLSFIFSCVGLVATYLSVDRKVQRFLITAGQNKISGIYSDTIVINDGTILPKSGLEKRLSSRGYNAVNYTPKDPGEYELTDDLLTLVTKPFETPDGSISTSKKIRYHYLSGEIRGDSNKLVLEPVLISPIGGGDIRASSELPLSEIPTHMQKAVLAVEDARFYKHIGIDPIGILRALARNIVAGGFVQGGSTLTQQLAKNTLFTSKKTLGRKIKEALAALSLEKHLSKDEILRRYLNEIYLGQEGSVSLHGVEEASQSFFGKSVKDISIGQAALLAGMIRAPSAYSPRKHPERALERRDIALGEMLERSFITEKEFKDAKREKITILETFQHQKKAPYFVASLEQTLTDTLDFEGAKEQGVKIFTGIDSDIQECAEEASKEWFKKRAENNPSLKNKKTSLEQALVAIEPHSGLIRAWVGGRDFSENQFDHVLQAKRQVGSTIKPFLYLTAMDGSLNSYKIATPISILSDEPTGITLVTNQTWIPENYDHKYRGDVTARYALEHSLNIPAVYIAQRVGIPALVKTAQRFRLSDSIPSVPALALGALDTTLLRLVSAYGAIANQGIYVSPRMFKTINDSEYTEISSTDLVEQKIVDEGPIYVLTDILRGVVERGTAAVIRRDGFLNPAAGKTGTSDQQRDAWFVGFTPNLVAGVWTGYDDNKKTGLTGATASAPVWGNFMKCASQFIEKQDFVPPSSVVRVPLDSSSNELATPNCPQEEVYSEIFVRGTEPRNYCHIHSDSPTNIPSEASEHEIESNEPIRRRSFWDGLFG